MKKKTENRKRNHLPNVAKERNPALLLWLSQSKKKNLLSCSSSSNQPEKTSPKTSSFLTMLLPLLPFSLLQLLSSSKIKEASPSLAACSLCIQVIEITYFSFFLWPMFSPIAALTCMGYHLAFYFLIFFSLFSAHVQTHICLSFFLQAQRTTYQFD